MDAGTPLVELRDATKSYGAVRALATATSRCGPARSAR